MSRIVGRVFTLLSLGFIPLSVTLYLVGGRFVHHENQHEYHPKNYYPRQIFAVTILCNVQVDCDWQNKAYAYAENCEPNPFKA